MAKREKNFTRSYDDKAGLVEVSQGDETLISLDVSKVAESCIPAIVSRYTADVIVGVMNGALKAGKTVEDAVKLAEETVAKFLSGEFRFRSGTGESTLSTEEEIAVIAECVKAKFPTLEAAIARITAVYNDTTTNAKGVIQRKNYNKLKADPVIKLALSKARGETSDTDSILGA